MQRSVHSPCTSAILCRAAEPQVLLQLCVVAAADGVRWVVQQLLRQLLWQLPELLVGFYGCCNTSIVWGNNLAAVAPVHLQLRSPSAAANAGCVSVVKATMWSSHLALQPLAAKEALERGRNQWKMETI